MSQIFLGKILLKTFAYQWHIGDVYTSAVVANIKPIKHHRPKAAPPLRSTCRLAAFGDSLLGKPKGVMLSHLNIVSATAACRLQLGQYAPNNKVTNTQVMSPVTSPDTCHKVCLLPHVTSPVMYHKSQVLSRVTVPFTCHKSYLVSQVLSCVTSPVTCHKSCHVSQILSRVTSPVKCHKSTVTCHKSCHVSQVM